MSHNSRRGGRRSSDSSDVSSSVGHNASQRLKNFHCGVVSPKRTAFTKDNLGRNFYGCGNYEVIFSVLASVINCHFEWV